MLSVTGMLRLLMQTPWAVFRLMRLMRRERFDLVHTNTGVTVGGAMAARLARIPHVWHFREILSEFGFFLRLYQPLVMLLSDRLIFITGAVRDQFSSARLRGKGRVIYDGIAVSEFDESEPENDRDPVVITSVGRLAPYKGQEILIQAIDTAVRRGIDLEAFIVGDVYGDRHEYRTKLQSMASELGLVERVHFTGFQSDVRPFLRRCNIFVLSSVRAEGLGIVMLEAMAAGRAIIATDGGGAPEVVTDGENGVLIPPGNSDKMADAIVRLASNGNERKQLAARGKETVKSRFSETAMVDAALEIFDETLAAAGTRQ